MIEAASWRPASEDDPSGDSVSSSNDGGRRRIEFGQAFVGCSDLSGEALDAVVDPVRLWARFTAGTNDRRQRC